ncbi:MAG: NAD(P)H-dependent oxidoreductase [Clostridiaceae bacterium]|mgnify:CR=1 FL=1|nr:NAD(P)H-dependent oxidoreductase [Clostridiaceae bacterium]
MKYKIAIIVGSLRKNSYSGQIAGYLSQVFSDSFEIVRIPIGDLALYNPDLDEEPSLTPESWQIFRDTMRTCDAVLFVTPEYNRALPAALKNALDVGSRPYGSSIWDNKPGCCVSVSPGMIGGFSAQHQLRQSLVTLNVRVMQQPEAYLSQVHKLLAEDGPISRPDTRAFLQELVDSFEKWIVLLSR